MTLKIIKTLKQTDKEYQKLNLILVSVICKWEGLEFPAGSKD